MLTHTLEISAESVPHIDAQHKTFIVDGQTREVNRVVVSRTYQHHTPQANTYRVANHQYIEWRFVIEVRPVRKNGKPEQVRPSSRMYCPFELARDAGLLEYATAYYTLVGLWILAYKQGLESPLVAQFSPLALSEYPGLGSPEEVSVLGVPLQAWPETQQAIDFVDPFVRDLRAYLTGLGLGEGVS